MTDSSSHSLKRDYVLPETTALVAIGCLDLLLTIYLIATRQAMEANPLMQAVGRATGVWGFVAVKALMLAVPLTIAEYARRHNPQFVRSALRMGLILYIGMLSIAYLPRVVTTLLLR